MLLIWRSDLNLNLLNISKKFQAGMSYKITETGDKVMLGELKIVVSPPNFKKWRKMMGDESEGEDEQEGKKDINKSEKINVDDKDETLPLSSLPKNN